MADNSAGTKLGATPWLHKIQPIGVDGNVLIDFCRPAAAAIPCRCWAMRRRLGDPVDQLPPAPPPDGAWTHGSASSPQRSDS